MIGGISCRDVRQRTELIAPSRRTSQRSWSHDERMRTTEGGFLAHWVPLR